MDTSLKETEEWLNRVIDDANHRWPKEGEFALEDVAKEIEAASNERQQTLVKVLGHWLLSSDYLGKSSWAVYLAIRLCLKELAPALAQLCDDIEAGRSSTPKVMLSTYRNILRRLNEQ